MSVATSATLPDLHTIWSAVRTDGLVGHGDGLRVSENANWLVPLCSVDGNDIG